MAIVTFTSDFGLQDGYVAAVKGVVLGLCPDATLVDVSHQIAPQDVASGAFVLAQAAPHFPIGTIHVAVVDPGVGGARRDLVVRSGGHVFVGPDNGLLSLAAPKPDAIVSIASPQFMRDPVSPTFHGRDVFAYCAGRLAAGAPLHEAGPPVSSIKPLYSGISGASGGEVRVLHVDHYGNVITSMSAQEDLPEEFLIDVLGPQPTHFEARRATTFCDVEVGALLGYRGSSGFVELAERNGSAAARIGVGLGDMLRLRSK